MKYVRVLKLSSLVVCGLLVLAASSQAQDRRVVDKAKTYLDTTHNAKQILRLAHMGADLRSYAYAGESVVNDLQGNRKPGHFAHHYDYDWEWNGQGYTRLAFIYDENGVIYDIAIMKTNGVANAPFDLSSASIQLVGGLFIEAMRNSATQEEIRGMEAAIRNANSKALLINSIKIGQATGIRL